MIWKLRWFDVSMNDAIDIVQAVDCTHELESDLEHLSARNHLTWSTIRYLDFYYIVKREALIRFGTFLFIFLNHAEQVTIRTVLANDAVLTIMNEIIDIVDLDFPIIKIFQFMN